MILACNEKSIIAHINQEIFSLMPSSGSNDYSCRISYRLVTASYSVATLNSGIKYTIIRLQ